jgi:putative acetyltransferase
VSGFRHLGLGRVFSQRIIECAREFGYPRMVLDTLNSMQGAQALYRSPGFVEIGAYYDNPLPGVLYFAIDISSS